MIRPGHPVPAYPGDEAAMSTGTLAESSIDAAFKVAAQSRYAGLRALGPIHRARILNGIPRFPGLRLTIPTAELSWIPVGMMRGPLSLPVSVTPKDRP